jgi:general secretion pathway protein H
MQADLTAPAPRRKRIRVSRCDSHGLTLIELMIAMSIAAVLFSGAVVGVGAITGAKAKAAAGELAGVVRALYDSAALSGKTCRLAFQLSDSKEEGPTKYWAECAAGNVTTARDRDEAQREEQRRRAARTSNRPPELARREGEPNLQDLLAQEKERVEAAAKYSLYTAPEIAPRELPSNVKVSVWTRHQREPSKTGTAFLYFFPQGFTEKAMVFLRQGDNVWTLQVQPLTGKATVFGEQLEVPKS